MHLCLRLCVAVIYFLFLIFIMVSAVVFTIIVQRLHLRSDTKPLKAMPMWVSGCVCQIRSYRNVFRHLLVV